MESGDNHYQTISSIRPQKLSTALSRWVPSVPPVSTFISCYRTIRNSCQTSARPFLFQISCRILQSEHPHGKTMGWHSVARMRRPHTRNNNRDQSWRNFIYMLLFYPCRALRDCTRIGMPTHRSRNHATVDDFERPHANSTNTREPIHRHPPQPQHQDPLRPPQKCPGERCRDG